VTGYLVPHGDVRALADRMVELAAQPDLVERLGHGARAFAETLSWDAAAAAAERHLAGMIGKGGGPQ
jgi:glycosyltransferase involved in cell wall biosynthesis